MADERRIGFLIFTFLTISAQIGYCSECEATQIVNCLKTFLPPKHIPSLDSHSPLHENDIYKDLHDLTTSTSSNVSTVCSSWQKNKQCLKRIKDDCEDETHLVYLISEQVWFDVTTLCTENITKEYVDHAQCLEGLRKPIQENLLSILPNYPKTDYKDGMDPSGDLCKGLARFINESTNLVDKKCGKAAADFHKKWSTAKFTVTREDNGCTTDTLGPIDAQPGVESAFHYLYVLPIAIGSILLILGAAVTIGRYRSRNDYTYDEMPDSGHLITEEEFEIRPLRDEPSTSSV